MALEALSTNELFNFIIDDTFSATPHTAAIPPETTTLKSRDLGCGGGSDSGSSIARPAGTEPAGGGGQRSAAAQGRKKLRRRAKVCKNQEEAETQRLTHIVVERNRRKQMNEHLAVLRSLMPESYVQRGDQASIVGGAIEYVKELEHLLQSLEAQKLLFLQQGGQPPLPTTTAATTIGFLTTPFAQFFAYPQYTWSQLPNKYTSKSKEAMADIEVTMIDTHANLRILSRKNFRQLSKLVTEFHTLCLTILHLNVTTLDPLVLYSISAKVEEGCQLTSADEIAGAVHHMLRIIEGEATLC
ncbi:Transcription factor bHLH71 like [Actinidia chinensis var. chinensis]|uniref:Transcription factor bHLH71 like n=1 Tax=Actinidia chinensis var. chinensis TaxID=1590841 RepID=A0A2R6PCZ4_ACTCC|nr:Transcription factor bHLH71 like [Actinidia chinensis var. chinensis]